MRLQRAADQRRDTPQNSSAIAGLFVLAIGLVVIAGWLGDIELLKSVLADQGAIKFNSALAFVLAGFGIFHIHRNTKFSRVSAVFLLVLGLLTLVEYVSGRSFGIDQFFLQDVSTLQNPFAGRMSPPTAVNVLLVGLSLFFIAGNRIKAGQFVAVVLVISTLVSLAGYLYNESNVDTSSFFSQMTIPTAIAFAVAGFGILSSNHRAGYVGVLTSEQAGGTMAQRVLPTAILAPLILGWVRLQGQNIGLYDTNFGLAIFAVANISVFTLLIYWNARRLNQVDLQRGEAMDSLRRSNEELEARVSERTRDLLHSNEELKREIAERRLVEQALRQNEETLQTIFDLLPVGASVMTNERKIVRMNAALQNILRVDVNELVAGNYRAIKYINVDSTPITTEDLPSVRAIAQQQPVLDVEIGIAKEDKPIIWTSVSAAPLPRNQGAIIVTVDITQRKQTELFLTIANEQLQAANKEIQQFVHIVSHDLRAPLINLKGFSDILGNAIGQIKSVTQPVLPLLNEADQAKFYNAINEEIPTSLHFINTSVDRMDSFTTAILKLSRLGHYSLTYEWVPLNVLVERVVNSLAAQIAENHIRVEVDPLPEVYGDRVGLDQILGNIITNAVKYLDPSRPGQIHIYSERDGDCAVITVEDNGRGIAEVDFEKVFAPFRRAGRQTVEGEGMGLAYVQALVKRHQGKIWFTSTPDVGSKFSFTLQHGATEET